MKIRIRKGMSLGDLLQEINEATMPENGNEWSGILTDWDKPTADKIPLQWRASYGRVDYLILDGVTK